MKLEYIDGNILNVEEGYILQGVNCLGVMGSGVAVPLRKRFGEDMFEEYAKICENHRIDATTPLGEYHLWESLDDDAVLINIFTQQETGGRKPMSYDALDDALLEFASILQYDNDPRDIYMPQIGAGLGGGNWNVIEQIINDRLGDLPNKVVCVLFDG